MRSAHVAATHVTATHVTATHVAATHVTATAAPLDSTPAPLNTGLRHCSSPSRTWFPLLGFGDRGA